MPLQVPFKYVDDLATIWCEWAEMELRHKNFKRALDLLRRATTPPANLGQRRVSCDDMISMCTSCPMLTSLGVKQLSR